MIIQESRYIQGQDIIKIKNIKIKIKGIDDGDVSPGFVLCSSVNPITTGKVFDAQVFRYS